MKRPSPGTVCQFLHSQTCKLAACLIVGYDEENKQLLKIKYTHPVTHEVVEDAFIHVTDIVDDEDVATHDFE